MHLFVHNVEGGERGLGMNGGEEEEGRRDDERPRSISPGPSRDRWDTGPRPSTVGMGMKRLHGDGEVRWRTPVSLPASASLPRARSNGRGGNGRGSNRHASPLQMDSSGTLRPSTSGTMRSGVGASFMEPMHPGESSSHLSRVYGTTVRWDVTGRAGHQKVERQLNARSEMDKILAPDRIFTPDFGDGTYGLTPLHTPGEGTKFIPLNTIDPDGWKKRIEELVRERLMNIRHMNWWEPPKSHKVAREGGEGPQSSPDLRRRTRSPRRQRRSAQKGKKKVFVPSSRARIVPERSGTSPLPSRMHPAFLMSDAPTPGRHNAPGRANATPARRRPIPGPKNLSFYSEMQSRAATAKKGKASTMYGKSFDNEHAGDRRLPVFEFYGYNIRPGPSFALDVDGSPRTSREASPRTSRPTSGRSDGAEADLMRRIFEDEYREMDADQRQRHHENSRHVITISRLPLEPRNFVRVVGWGGVAALLFDKRPYLVDPTP